MENFLFLFIYIQCLIFSILSKETEEINEFFIEKNFQTLSQKSNLIKSFTKIDKTGNISLLESFLEKLKKNNIDFNSEFESFYQKKHKSLEKIFNKLKYKDEINIKRLSPAFEWAETERQVILFIKHSSFLNSLSCPFVDDEDFVIRSNKQDIHYEAKCILDNNYLFFILDLRLYSYVTVISKKEVQRGETRFILEKRNQEDWDGRLIDAGTKMPENSFRMY